MKRLISLLCVILLLAMSLGGFGVNAQTEGVITLGNPDGNGNVNASDALIALKQAVGKGEYSLLQISACDVNCNDSVDALDALEILKYSVGKQDAFAATGLRGNTVTIGTIYSDKYENNAFWREAVESVEEQYGVTIAVEQISLADDKDSLWLYDLVELPVHNARVFAKEGLLKNLSDNAALDWVALDSGSTESLVMGDMIAGAASDAMSANPMGLAMNRELLEKYAPSAYSQLKNRFLDGSWTFDALSDLVEEYRRNAPGAAVMVSNTNIIGQAIVANAGYEVTFLEDGTGAVCSIASQEGIEALTYIKGFLNSGAWQYEADGTKLYEAFGTGKVPMMVYYLNDAALAARNGDFALTAMPFPKGPRQDDYVMCTFNSSAFAIPEDAALYGNGAAIVLNALAREDSRIAESVVASAVNNGYDELGQLVYAWAAQNTTKDFSTGPFTGAVGGPVDGSVLDASKNPAVELPRIARLIQSEVDAYYGQFYRK